MMYGRAAKQIKIIALISFIISIATSVLAFMQEDEIGDMYWLIPVAPLIMTFDFMSLVLNFKKIFRGLIAPIPVLSFFIEYLKGYFYSIKALLWALKQPKNGSDQADMKAAR